MVPNLSKSETKNSVPTHGAYYIDYLEVFPWVINNYFSKLTSIMDIFFSCKAKAYLVISEIRNRDGMNVGTRELRVCSPTASLR